MRDVLGSAKSIVPSTVKLGPVGVRIDVHRVFGPDDDIWLRRDPGSDILSQSAGVLGQERVLGQSLQRMGRQGSRPSQG